PGVLQRQRDRLAGEVGDRPPVDLAHLGQAETDDRGGRLHRRTGSDTVTSPPASDHSSSSTSASASARRLPATLPRTTTVCPTVLNLRIRNPAMRRIRPSSPTNSRTARSHMPSKKPVFAYISGAPDARASSLLWWMELKSRFAPAATTS